MAYESEWELSTGAGFGQDILRGSQSCPAKLTEKDVTVAVFFENKSEIKE